MKSINERNDNVSRLIEKFGHHRVIKPTNFFYLEFRAGMNFQRMPNGKIAYFTVDKMY